METVKNEILISTGCFTGRLNGFSPDGFLSAADRLAVDGFEFMMYRAWYGQMDRLLPLYLASGRRYPTFHVEKTVGECFSVGTREGLEEGISLFRENCRIARALGSSLLILHLWNGLPSDYRIAAHIDAVGELLGIAESEGLTLTVENVVCADRDPMTHFATLAERYPTLGFTFDTKMAAFHHQLEQIAAPEWRYLWNDGRIRHVHCNDYGGGYRDFSGLRVLQIGEGWIEFTPFFRLLREVRYGGRMTLECTAMSPLDGSTDPAGLIRSIAAVRRFLGQKEPGTPSGSSGKR